MNRQHFLDALDFDDDAVFDDEVDAVRRLRSSTAFVDDGQTHLVLETADRACVNSFDKHASYALSSSPAPSAV